MVIMEDFRNKRLIKILSSGEIEIKTGYVYGPVLVPFPEKIDNIKHMVRCGCDIRILDSDGVTEYKPTCDTVQYIIEHTKEPTPIGCATTEKDGIMEASDKLKLDNIAEYADNVEYTQLSYTGTKIGEISINGTKTSIYAPNDGGGGGGSSFDPTKYYLKTETYSKAEVDKAIDDVGDPLREDIDSLQETVDGIDLTKYYLKTEVDQAIKDGDDPLREDIDSLQETVDGIDLTKYYLKTETYTKTEVNNAIATGDNSIREDLGNLQIVVNKIPTSINGVSFDGTKSVTINDTRFTTTDGKETFTNNVVAPEFEGNLTGTASKAISDEDGNNIKSTYDTKESVNAKVQEVSDQLVINSLNNNGFVSAGTGHANKVWKTDNDGNPGWRDDENTTYSEATRLTSGLMSADDKFKLDKIPDDITKINVDSALSTTSINPVQNKVITNKINSMYKEVTQAQYDALPETEKEGVVFYITDTDGVTDEVAQDLQRQINVNSERIDTLSSLSEGSTTGDAELIDGRITAYGTVSSSIGDAIRSQITDLNNRKLNTSDLPTVDSTVTSTSNNPVSSKAVYNFISQQIYAAIGGEY